MPEKKPKKRADGRYCCTYRGKQFMAWDPDEAIRKRNDYKYRCEHGYDDLRPVSVKTYADEWLPLYKEGKVQLNTYNQYAILLDKLNTLIGDRLMSAVTPDDVARVWKIFDGQSRSQIRKAAYLYRRLFDSARESGFCRKNPFRSDVVTVPKGTSGSHRALKDWERRLIETTPHRMQLPALVMLYAGLRRGELVALQYNHVQDGYFEIRQAVTFAGAEPQEKKTKNESSMRRVPVLAPLRPYFYDDNGDPLKTFGYVCPSADGLLCSESAWKRAWESYISTLETALNGVEKRWYHRTKDFKQSHPDAWAEYEKLKRTKPKQAEEYRLMGWRSVTIRPHDLRHSFCEWTITNGVDPKTVMSWMGHTDERMIMKIYDHVTNKREAAAIALLDNSYANSMQDKNISAL